jgi:hypothetical protein
LFVATESRKASTRPAPSAATVEAIQAQRLAGVMAAEAPRRTGARGKVFFN